MKPLAKRTSYELLQRTLDLKQEVNQHERDVRDWYDTKGLRYHSAATMPSYELDEMAILIKKEMTK